MKKLVVERVVVGSVKNVWQVVSDVAKYSRYAPNIDSSVIISGRGVGMIRECRSKEGRWTECCTHWQEGRTYSFDVQTHEHDYPYPFRTLQAKWTVQEKGLDQTLIRLEFNFEFTNRLLGVILQPLLRSKYHKICEQLMDNWQMAIAKNGC